MAKAKKQEWKKLTPDEQEILEGVRIVHKTWLDANPGATLGTLLARLEEVRDDMQSHDEDDDIEEADLGEETRAYLADYELGEDRTIGYRMANVEEDIEQVEAAIAEMGADTVIVTA